MTRSATGSVVGSSPSVGRFALTDLSAVFGGAVWLAVVVAGSLSAIERAVVLAPLVLVPLGLTMVGPLPVEGLPHWLYPAAVVLQPVGAVCVLASFLVSTPSVAAGAAVVWLLVTGLLGVVGLQRLVDRGGLAPISDTAIDSGLVYSVVGAVALVLHHLGISFWFEPVIILLTAIHFHYAGFVLPVLAGLTGRAVGTPGRGFQLLTGVILLGPAIIAVGISFSPLVEFVAVGLFTTTVAVFGGYVVVRVVPDRSRIQGLCLVGSALALPVSMLLALAYAVMVVSGIDPLGVSLSRMVRFHGSLNAFGFALLGLLGWRVDVPVRTGTT